MTKNSLLSLAWLIVLVGTGCQSEVQLDEKVVGPTFSVDRTRIANADSEPEIWISHGRTYDEQRYSPLTSINDENVAQLSLAWYRDTNSKRGLEATPIIVDGHMFTTGSWSTVQAYDAKTGETIWEYDPEVPKSWGKFACCDVVNRGVAIWKGRIYVGTLDGRLVALAAASGEVDWEVITIPQELKQMSIPVDSGDDDSSTAMLSIVEKRPYTITGAPRIVNDMVIIGNGGAELGVRGYITAYDAETGEQKWRFYTVPGDPSEPYESPAMEMAAETWQGDSWHIVGGGGTVWDSMAYDSELNLLYIGVGNGSPWNRHIRSPGGGDNLFLSSIVALNPDDGSYQWHYQTTPGDHWDYTATQHIILADLKIDGVDRKVLMQAPKNGFMYVIDRVTGELLSAEPYVPVNWASHVDLETGRPIETENADYLNESKLVQPGPLGGHNWHPMTFSPDTGLVYIPAIDLSFTYTHEAAFEHEPGQWNLAIGPRPEEPEEPITAVEKIEAQIEALQSIGGRLLAWDPVKQEERWRVEHVSTWNGGLLSTAGNLVFQGRSDGMFAAYSADSGALLWEMPTYTGIIAAPVTYEIDGEQYVAVVAGWGGAFATTAGVPRHKGNVLQEGRVLVYKLNGDAKMPPPSVTHVNIPQPPVMEATPEQLQNGGYLYGRYCSICHGGGVTSGSQIPDLKYLPEATHRRWNSVVINGIMSGVGMPGFANVLSESDSEDIQRFVIATTNDAIAFCQSTYPEEYPELFGTACTQRVVESEETPATE